MLNRKDLEDLTKIQLKPSPDIWFQNLIRAQRTLEMNVIWSGIRIPGGK